MPRNLHEADPKSPEDDQVHQLDARLDPEDRGVSEDFVELELELDHFGVSCTPFDDDDAYDVEGDDIYETVDLDRLELGDGPDA